MDILTIYRKPMGENLFEEEFTVEALSQMGNPLERLSSLVDFEMFRPVVSSEWWQIRQALKRLRKKS